MSEMDFIFRFFFLLLNFDIKIFKPTKYILKSIYINKVCLWDDHTLNLQ